MIKEGNNKLIIRAKKKRRVRKIIIISVMFMIGGIVFATKSDFFIIKKVSILGNPTMSGEDIKKRTENLVGQNILFINKKNITNEAKKNPYVANVEITKTYPKQVNIKVLEKQGVYYVEKEGYYYILDNGCNLLEKTDNIENRSLVDIIGINLKDVEPGNRALDDSRIIKLLDIFYQIINKNPTNHSISSIDLSDLMYIKVYIGQVEGRLGNDENIPDKMNRLLHIIENSDIGIKKGKVI
jgi:cell division protein FtsQ